MAAAFGNLRAARERASEITFVAQESYNQRGRNRTREHRLPPVRSFAELLWNGYAKAPEMAELHGWIANARTKPEGAGDRRRLTAASLADALAEGTCPVEAADPWFARSVVLLSALLPKPERLALLEFAVETGCTPIADAYFAASDPGPPGALPAIEAMAERPDTRPRLVLPAPAEARAWSASPQVHRQVEALDAAEREYRERRRDAEAALGVEPDSILDASADVWQATIDAVERARAASVRRADLRKACEDWRSVLRSELLGKLGFPVAADRGPSGLSPQALAAALVEIDIIRIAIEAMDPGAGLVAEWRAQVDAEPTTEALWDLVRATERDVADSKARTAFREEAAAYCAASPASEVAAFLTGLGGEGLAALLPRFVEAPWLVGGAILLRASLDRGGEGLPAGIFEALSVPVPPRRALLRFVDPASAAFDADARIRRLVAMERLRDAIAFGPLAQVSDPASGLSDVRLVGRSVHDLIESIVGNLDILATGSELVRILRVRPPKSEIGERLMDFVHAPATMGGHHRRLRETARALLLSPLIVGGRPDAAKAKPLLSMIASGQALEDVIAAFSRECPNERLDPRHREQLSRYLHRAESVVGDFLGEPDDKPDSRRRAFSSTLRRLRGKLKGTGELGTVEWLEAEVAALLDGHGTTDDRRTLVGDATPMSARRWDDSDREWATSFIDLPEFHGGRPSSLDVMASVLCWRSRGKIPAARDVVVHLIERNAFGAALRVAGEHGDEAGLALVIEAAKPTIAALEARAAEISDGLDPGRSPPALDRQAFGTALAELRVEAAEEMLELWQLALAGHEEQRAAELLNQEAGERRGDMLARLRHAGLDPRDERMSLAELEAAWSDVLASREDERAHLDAVAAALAGCGTAQPDLMPRLAGFRDACQDPRRWLPPAVSADFAILVQEASLKIAGWIEHSPNYRETEQAALVALTAWYLDFVAERSLSLRQQDEVEGVQAGLERVLEVADAILQTKRPSDCLAQLSESGEMDAIPPSHAGVALDAEEHETPPAAIAARTDAPTQINPTANKEGRLPEAVLSALRAQDWGASAELCESLARATDAAQAERLRQVARAIGPLIERSALPGHGTADMLPSTAAWLSGQADGAAEIGESHKAELAFRILVGAIAADSGQEISPIPGPGGSWAELLGKTSPFRRMLSAGLPSRTGRVLEALVSGTLGLVVAERLWDAATNLSEPQLYRTPLLNLLNDHGAQEVILKLAQRHEAAIAPRLSQLFELRAVAQNRPDLLPVAQSVAEHLASQAKGAPFRSFVRSLPSAAQMVKPMLRVAVDGSVHLRALNNGTGTLELPIIVTPEGLVPARLFAKLFADDDVTFDDNTRLKDLCDSPIYFATDFTVGLRFGRSWFAPATGQRDTVRIRIEAKTVTDELIHEDAVCPVRPVDRARSGGPRLDTDTLLDLYPGVANNPVVDRYFVGRIDELERLHQALISAKNPSPVLLTGMRRIGKTSLLYEFHKRCSQKSNSGAISIYQSLAERKVEFSSLDHTVSGTFFKAISHGLVRPHLTADDRNHALCARIRQRFNDDWKSARRAIQECYDEESLSGSLMVLAERLREWTSSTARFIILIDEAEALVTPYQLGGRKKVELEQFLQSLREISQTTGSVGLLLSGSNHINVFAREYKNAFFGSSQTIELEGFGDVRTSAKIIAPKGIEAFVQFDEPALSYARNLCAGMPQFLWQIGATTAFQVRTGTATRSDIRAAVTMVVGPERLKLPFRPYEILEPIDNMLSLESPRERDLLWMLLYRVAQASSLVAQDGALPFVIDQALLAVDDRSGWRKRLRTLVDLKVLRMESASSVRFQVPLFAEGFRAPRNWQEFNIRQQQVAI